MFEKQNKLGAGMQLEAEAGRSLGLRPVTVSSRLARRLKGEQHKTGIMLISPVW